MMQYKIHDIKYVIHSSQYKILVHNCIFTDGCNADFSVLHDHIAAYLSRI